MKRIILAIAPALALMACSGGSSNSNGRTITLGAMIALTGADSDPEDLQAINLAVSQINGYLAQLDGGFLAGATIAVKNLDDGSSTTTAVSDVQQLIDAGIQVIIGPETSDEAVAMAPVTIANNVLLITGSATSPALTTIQDAGVRLVYRTVPSDALQGKLLAEIAEKQTPKITKVAALYTPGAYGQGLSDTFLQVFSDGGGTVTADVQLPPGQSSYLPQLDAAYDGGPDAILMVSDNDSDAAQVINNYLTSFAASNPNFWFFTDGLDADSFVMGVNQGQSSFTFPNLGTAPSAATGPNDTVFQNAFTAQYGAGSYDSGNDDEQYYDAVFCVVLAMQEAASSNGVAIAQKLQAVGNGPGPTETPSQFLAAMQSINSGMGVTYSGASGSTAFNANGDVIGNYDVWAVQPDAGIVVEEPDQTP